LKTIGITLLDLRSQQATKRKIMTEITREDFQIAVENDRLNKKTEIFSDDYNLNDNFFQSNPERKSTKKRRKSINERGSSEADNEKDKAESEAQDFISKISDEDDDSDYRPSDVEDPPPLLTSSQFKCFDESYAKMKKTQKWILQSGTCVEDVIFEYCKELSAESLLHSWIIDLDDQEAEDLFTNEEWTVKSESYQRLTKPLLIQCCDLPMSKRRVS
jgi:hypothetical protein